MANILITGSRNIKIKEYIYYILDNEIQDGDYVIQGGADGVDEMAMDWCNKTTKKINWKTYYPVKKWLKEYYLHRNAEMIGKCDRVIAIWDGKSRGTEFTIKYAEARGIPVKIYTLNTKNE